MNIQEAKEILVPLCPSQADGRPLSPGFCDADLVAIADHIDSQRLFERALTTIIGELTDQLERRL